MAKYIDADQIRAEIERLESKNNCGTSEFIEAKRIAYNQVKKVLDSIPKQVKRPSRDQVGTKFAVEGLEEEVKRYYADNFDYISSEQPTLSILTNIARHFAEWGAKQVKSND